MISIDKANPKFEEAKRRDQAALFGKHQPPKKRRKSRTAFTNQQIYELEKRFLYQKYLTPADRDEIAASLGLTNAQVITWFQNRRAKLKRDLEELKNDVTAAKKFPSHKSGSHAGGVMSLAELELRRVQEKTLRDSFNNGGLQSPSSSSITSVTSEDGPEHACTPLRSPVDITSLSGADDGSSVKVRAETPRKLLDDDMDISEKERCHAEAPTDLTRSGSECCPAVNTVDQELPDKPKNEISNSNYTHMKEEEKGSNTFATEHRASLMET
ncbi:transcription factor LBX1 [Elysia marginata]|uniref:Transcription factor LBX1 n=1 Tax=Elysia marginata TaxID=1093978 RepID=A0AAV4HD58_9GAST|nr:transcription factor LBX1 [Elysia marginata]